MILEVLEKIKKKLGSVLKHSAIIYTDGTVLQSTFPDNVNVRGIGDNLAEALSHLNMISEFLQYESSEFSNELIFRTPNYYILAIRTHAVIVVLILDLSPEDNGTYRTWELDDIYGTISNYLDDIKRLADWDKSEFEIEEIKEETEKIEKEIEKLKETGKKIKEKDSELREEKKKIRDEKKEIREIEKIAPEEEVDKIQKDLEKLKKKEEKIRKEEKKILKETQKLREKSEEIIQKKEELEEKEKEIIKKKEESE
jgi:predicted regulator of Ras-like GTPase activity (Roadblock/LC7/MglB family)